MMEKDLQKAAEKFLSGEDGKKIAGKKGEIERLAASRDGEQVRAQLQRNGFEDAVKKGDTEAMKNAISSVLKTEEGARLMRQLQSMMGKN